jgi:urea transport system substrate-binding protein
MRRWVLLGAVLAVLGSLAGGIALFVSWRDRTPILVGLLHSQTGPWAVTERSMLDAEMLAIEEINAAGGLLGRPVRAIKADARSDVPTSAQEAQRLIHDEKVSVIIGGWSSEARKAIRTVVEEAQHLLIYPPSYEGLEQSPNIVYVGGPANHQVTPAVSWFHDVKKARKFFLIVSDSLWAHAVAAVVKDQLHSLRAELVDEVSLGADEGRLDVKEAVARIERTAPDVVISTVDGPDNATLYAQLRRSGITPDKIPVVSFSLNEEEARRLPIADVVGQYSGWNYFQSLDRPENREFARKFQERYGRDRVIDDDIQISYEAVRLWAQTVVEAGTDDVRTINREILRQSRNAPEGIITIDAENQHGWRPFFMGRVRPDGQFEILWSLTKSIRPVPYPSSRTREEWDTFVDGLMSGGIGRKSGSGPKPWTGTAARDRVPL